VLPSEAVAEVQEHDFQDILATRIYPLLTNESRRLASMYPFPFLEGKSVWTESVVSADSPLAGAPTDISAVRRLGCPAIAENNGNLQYLRRDYVMRIFGVNTYLTVDFPQYYYMWGGQLYVYPYFNVSTIFSLDYIKKIPTLGAGTTEAQWLIPSEYQNIVIDRVLARLSRSEGDLQDGETFDARATSAVQEMQAAFNVNQDSPDPMMYTPDPLDY